MNRSPISATADQTSSVRQRILALRAVDEHEAKALELEHLGETRFAGRVRRCGRRSGSPFGMYPCNERSCPSCSETKARQAARSVLEAIQGLKWRAFVTVTRKSEGLEDLGDTISAIRRHIRALRGHPAFGQDTGVVGGIEPKLAISRSAILRASASLWS